MNRWLIKIVLLIGVALIATIWLLRPQTPNFHGEAILVFSDFGGSEVYSDFYEQAAVDLQKWLEGRNFLYVKSIFLSRTQKGSIKNIDYRGTHDGSPEFFVAVRVIDSSHPLGPGWGLEAYISWSDYGDPTNEIYFDDFQEQLYDWWIQYTEQSKDAPKFNRSR